LFLGGLFPLAHFLKGMLVFLFLMGCLLLVVVVVRGLGNDPTFQPGDLLIAIALTLPGAALLWWELWSWRRRGGLRQSAVDQDR
jgi:hypothetical protein